MIAAKHRFHGYNSLRQVYQHGRQVRSSMTTLKVLKNDRRRYYRMAVVVSRKVNKSAVVRNRIRRRIYEQVRHEEANIQEPVDMVFTVFSEQVATLAAQDLKQLIHDQLKAAGII